MNRNMTTPMKITIEVLACILLAVWLTCFGPIVHKVESAFGADASAIASRTVSTQVTDHDARRAKRHAFEERLLLTAAAYADAKVASFQSGALWNSRGYTMPVGVQAAGNFWCGFHPGSCQTRWWDAPLTAVMCIPYMQGTHCGSNSMPARQQTEFHQKMVAADMILIKCGGAAAIGFVGLTGGAAWWGAGKGAGVCLWITLFTYAFNWKIAVTHNTDGLSNEELARKVVHRSDRMLARAHVA